MSEVSLSVRIGSDLRDIKQGLNTLRNDLDAVRRTGNRRVEGLDRIRNQLTMAAGAARQLVTGLAGALGAGGFVAALTQSTRAATQFSTAMAEVSTLLSDTSGMDEMTAKVRELAKEYGAAPVDQARALYGIISAGATDSAEALSILDTANKLAIGGVTNVAIAADGLTSIMNAYGGEISGAAEVSDALFVAMRAGKTTIEELSSSIGQVAPLAATAGVSFDELSAAVAAITTGGVRTNVAVTQLRAAINAVVKPSQEAEELADKLGIAFNLQGIRAQGLAGFLEQVREKTGGNEAVMARLFGSVESLGAVFALTGNQADKFNEILDQQANKAGQTEQALSRMAETPGQVFARLRSTIGDNLVTLGNRLLGVLVPAARALTENFQEVLRAVEALTVYLVLRYVPALALAGKASLSFAAILTGLTRAVAALRTALIFLTGPAGLLAAFGTAIYLLATADDTAAKASRERRKAIDELNKSQGLGIQLAIDAAKAARDQAKADLDAARARLAMREANLQTQEAQGGQLMPDGSRRVSANLAATIERDRAQAATLQSEIQELDAAIVAGTVRQLEYNRRLRDTGDAATEASEGLGELVRGLVDVAELAKDSIDRALSELDRLLAENQISLADYFARKQTLQLEAIDLAIAQAEEEAKLAKTSEAQSNALTQIVKLQRDRAEIGPSIAREQAVAEEALTKKLEDLRIKLLELEGQTGTATAQRLQNEFAEMRAQLLAEGNEAGLELVDRVINIQATRAQLEQFRREVSDTMSKLAEQETSLSAQANAGMMGTVEAERQIKDARNESLRQLYSLREAVLAYYEDTQSPEVLDYLVQLNGSIASVEASQQRLRQQIADTAIDAMTNFFMDLATGAKSAKDALIDFVRSFVAGMAQIAARALATYLVLQLLDAVYPGLGKATAAMMGAGEYHDGGVVRAGGGKRREMPAWMVAGAPRYHRGGFAGLKPGEVPAVLQTGEEVLSRDNPRNALNGGANGGGQRSQRFIFVDDQRRAADFFNAPEGEDVFFEILSRRPGTVREIMAGA